MESSDRLLHDIVDFDCPKRCAVKFVNHGKETDEFWTECLTYNELEEWSSVICHKIRTSHSDETETVVALDVQLSAHVVALIIGILKAGFAFLWLSADDTNEFRRETVKRSGARFLITESLSEWQLNNASDVKLGTRTFHFGEFSKCGPANFNCSPSPALAYVIQTSGTTGYPKTVRVPHRCIVPNIIDLRERWNVERMDSILLTSPLTFDPSIVELFVSLSAGACLIMVPDELKRDPHSLSRIILYEPTATVLQVASVHLVAQLRVVTQQSFLGASSPLKSLIFGGEPFPPLTLFSHLKWGRSGPRIFNIYGITEVSCWATCSELCYTDLSEMEQLSIGAALNSTALKLRDPDGTDLSLADDCEGQLFVGSETRKCLVDDESWESAPDLRGTGDLCRITNGKIYVIGRIDHQIKRMGKRINLTQIEQAVVMSQFVRNCAAFYDEATQTLICALVLCSGGNVAVVEKHLQDALPSYAKPDQLICLDQLPLNKHGKVDRSKLLKQLMNNRNKRKRSPSGVLDADILLQILKDITGESMELESMLRVDSLKAVQIVTQLETSTGRNYPHAVQLILGGCSVNDLFDNLKTVTNLNCTTVPKIPKTATTDVNVQQRSTETTFTLELVFRHDMEKCIDATPLLVETADSERVFIGSHSGRFACVDVTCGRIIWETKLPDRIEASAVSSRDKVIVGCYDGCVYFLNIQTGAEEWRFQTGDAVKSTAVIVSNTPLILIGSHDYNFYCLNCESRTLIWKQGLGGAVLSEPCLDSSGSWIFVATLGATVFCLNVKNGAIVWKQQLPLPIFGKLTCYDPDLLIVPCVDGHLHFLTLTTGKQLAKHAVDEGSPIFGGVSMCNDKAIISGSQSGRLQRLRIATTNTDLTTSVLWNLQLSNAILRPPLVFERQNSSFCCVSTKSGLCIILNVENGVCVAQFELGGECFCSAVLSRSDVLSIGCRDNSLYGFKLKTT